MADIKLTDKPNPKHVKKKDGADYIPIGHVEETLDEIYGAGKWGSENFRFHIFTLFESIFVSGTATLLTPNKDGEIDKMEGSGTFRVSPNDQNTNYEATVLSYCISNAAGRKGIVFGRALNGRLDKGETGLPTIDLKDEARNSKLDAEFERVKKLVESATTADEARKIMKTNGFSELNPELNKLLKSKQ